MSLVSCILSLIRLYANNTRLYLAEECPLTLVLRLRNSLLLEAKADASFSNAIGIIKEKDLYLLVNYLLVQTVHQVEDWPDFWQGCVERFL